MFNIMEPIEAYHPDGNVAPARASFGPRGYRVAFRDVEYPVERDGTIYGSVWRIRNVQPAAAKLSGIDEALVERMVVFMRKLDKWDGSYALGSDMTEARAIVAELPQSVDPALLEARRLCREFMMGAHGTEGLEDGDFDDTPLMKTLIKAVRWNWEGV